MPHIEEVDDDQSSIHSDGSSEYEGIEEKEPPPTHNKIWRPCGEDGLSTWGEFGGGPRSETGSRSRREHERVRGSGSVRSGRGWSEAAGMRAKRGENGLDSIDLGFVSIDLLGQDRRFIYMYKKCSLSISNTARGSRNKSD